MIISLCHNHQSKYMAFYTIRSHIHSIPKQKKDIQNDMMKEVISHDDNTIIYHVFFSSLRKLKNDVAKYHPGHTSQ